MNPNLITALRIGLLAPLYGLLAFGGPDQRWWALAVFLLAGLTDIVDGRVARSTGRTSASGAMLDLLADRLLTLVTLAALVQVQAISGLFVIAALVLIGRDLLVATLEAALPGRLGITVSLVEKFKVALQFVGMALLIAPPVWTLDGFIDQYELGLGALALSAAMACLTLFDYAARAAAAFRKG